MNISFVKSLQIRKSVVRGFAPSWKSVANLYNCYTFGVLTCKSANDAKGYTLVLSCVCIAIHPIFIIPSIIIYSTFKR